MSIKISVKNPWFSFIKEGKKNVEGRLKKGKFLNLKKGEKILITNNDEEIEFEIIDIFEYRTFREMLEQEGLNNVLPGINDINDGVSIYRQFYSEKDEIEKGVLAIKIKKS